MSNRSSSLRVESLDEATLVASAAGGDRLAFDELVRRHQQEVYTLAVRLLGNHEMAADVTQDALIRAWRHLGTFRGDAAFSTWLYRITVNTAWSARHRARRLATTDIDQVEHELPGIDHVGMAGEAMRVREAFRRALGELTPGARSVVVLKDVYGWSHAEVADSLGISVTAAKVRLHRARGALQRLLEDER